MSEQEKEIFYLLMQEGLASFYAAMNIYLHVSKKSKLCLTLR